MEELLAFLAKSLVDHPEDVSVTKVDGENSVVYELRVNDSDMGKVIGKQGRIAKSIRTIIKSASSKEDKRVIVDIVQQYYSYILKKDKKEKLRRGTALS